ALNSLNGLKNIYSCNKNNLADIPNDKKKIIAWVAYHKDTNIYSVNLNNYYANLTIDAGLFIYLLFYSYLIFSFFFFFFYYIVFLILLSYLNQNNQKNQYYLKNKLVFRNTETKNALGFSDWDEHSSSRPDITLQDLIAVQYPTYQQNYTIRWLERFSDSTVGN